MCLFSCNQHLWICVHHYRHATLRTDWLWYNSNQYICSRNNILYANLTDLHATKKNLSVQTERSYIFALCFLTQRLNHLFVCHQSVMNSSWLCWLECWNYVLERHITVSNNHKNVLGNWTLGKQTVQYRNAHLHPAASAEVQGYDKYSVRLWAIVAIFNCNSDLFKGALCRIFQNK